MNNQENKLYIRPYRPEDAKKVIGWINDEKQFYQWSAGRLGGYPADDVTLNEYYEKLSKQEKLYVMVACEGNEPVGQFIMRHPLEDKTEVRMGFIIVDSSKRGLGYGKLMLQSAFKFGFEEIRAEKLTLGVFEENDSAIKCYEKAGLKLNGKEEMFQLMDEVWKCKDMEINKDETEYEAKPDLFEEVQNELKTEEELKEKRKKERKEKKQKEQKTSALKEALSWVFTVAVSVVAAYVIVTYIIVNAVVPTGSMENTIMTGDRMIGLRFSYWFSEPERGDVVVFDFPLYEYYGYKKPVNYVKRVIGLPGETVVIENSVVYIYKDGDKTKEPVILEEDYLKENWISMTGPYEFVIPKDCYLMLGDNRNFSADARTWYTNVNNYNANNPNNPIDEDIIYIHKDDILGKAVCKYWPLNHIGLID